METLLRFLLQVEKKERVHDTEMSTQRSDEFGQGCNVLSQQNLNCNSLIHHREVRYGIGPCITRKKWWNGTDALVQVRLEHMERNTDNAHEGL